MTEFESTEDQKPTMLASLDHLSLRNWASPFEEASTPPTSDDSFQSSSEDNLSLRNWAPLSPNPETEKSAKSLRNYSTNPLIPSYICDLCESPKTSELRVAHDAPTFQTTYSYSISWDVEMDDVEHYRNVMETVSKSSAISSRSSFGGTPSPVVVKCDGPCKKEFPSNFLSTIGRCGHYLCTACFDIVKNADGTYGCSSQQCYWKGSSRQESKKYYEKDICRKQRAKALGMKDLGIDVKPASSASSNPIKEISDSSSETNCSLSSGTVSFNHRMLNSLTPVAENSVAIMMVLVEPVEVYGIVHSYVKMSFPLNTNLAKALGAMLHRKKKVLGDYVANGQLYFGFVNDDEKIGMRRIKSNYYDSLMVAEIPKFDDRVVLIFDVGDYVARGFKIYLE